MIQKVLHNKSYSYQICNCDMGQSSSWTNVLLYFPLKGKTGIKGLIFTQWIDCFNNPLPVMVCLMDHSSFTSSECRCVCTDKKTYTFTQHPSGLRSSPLNIVHLPDHCCPWGLRQVGQEEKNGAALWLDMQQIQSINNRCHSI